MTGYYKSCSQNIATEETTEDCVQKTRQNNDSALLDKNIVACQGGGVSSENNTGAGGPL